MRRRAHRPVRPAGPRAEDVALYAEILEKAGATDVAVADDVQEADLLLAGRRALSPALEAKGPRFLEDVCVPGRPADRPHPGGPRPSPPAAVLEITMSGHAGDGNLHPSIFFDADDPATARNAEGAFDEVVALAL